MEKTIWKFELEPGTTAMNLHKGAEILTIQTQRETPCMWVLLDPNEETEKRYFEIFGTGGPVPSNDGYERKYINTFQLSGGSLVFHLFERLN